MDLLWYCSGEGGGGGTSSTNQINHYYLLYINFVVNKPHSQIKFNLDDNDDMYLSLWLHCPIILMRN